jgi:hypothetical protein
VKFFVRHGNRVARAAVWDESISRRVLAQIFEEDPLLLAGQKFVVARDRVKQDLGVAVVHVCSR